MAREISPTYLCIKEHSVTGLKYLSKTTRAYDKMLKYSGSGKYWKLHIKEHRKEFVDTPWYCLFHNKKELLKFALICSEQWDIVNAKDECGKKIWANLKPENGLDGGAKGTKHPNRKKAGPQPEELVLKRAKAMLGKNKDKKLPPRTEEAKAKDAKAKLGNSWNKGKPWSIARRQAQENRIRI